MYCYIKATQYLRKNTVHGDSIVLLTETAVGSWLQQLENRKTSSDWENHADGLKQILFWNLAEMLVDASSI